MEYGLRLFIWLTRNWWMLGCLNPCCNGIWSQTYDEVDATLPDVLILVVMEYGLRQCHVLHIMFLVRVLILVVMEYGLRHC